MPISDDNTIDNEYKRGLQLARAGDWFAAHEAFELAWRAARHEERDFFQVPELPLLGTGKLDLRKVKEMALELVKRRDEGKA